MAKYKPKNQKYEREVLQGLYQKLKKATTKFEKQRLQVLIKVQSNYVYL